MKYIPLILIVVCGFCVSVEAGEVYEWIDKDGVKHFTQEAPPPEATLLNEKEEITSPDVMDTNNRGTRSENPKKELRTQDTAKTPAAPAVSSDYVDTQENYIDDPGVRRREEKRHQHRTIEAHGDGHYKTDDAPNRSRSEGTIK